MTAQLSFKEIVRKHIDSGKMSLPVFSHTAIRVQQELVKKEPDYRRINNLISADQSLSSEILKIANSSLYKGLTEILTIKAAIVRLGMQEIGKITLVAASKNQFRSGNKQLNLIMKKLWQHSVGCGLGAQWLAKRCKLEEQIGHAFFAGLLHDTGKLFILLVVDQLMKKNKDLKITDALLLEAMNSLHTEQGYYLMRKWNMPAPYCRIARDHHKDEYDRKDILLLLVRVSNMVCTKLGIGINAEPDLPVAASSEVSFLNLKEIDLAELEIKLEDTSVLTQ